MTKTIKLMDAADLKNRFKKIVPFMSTEETRYYLNGVYFEYANNNLRATATNGHILCTMEWELTEKNDVEPFNVIIPASAIKNLIKIIPAKKKEDGGVMLTISSNDTICEFDFFDFKYKAKCVDGTFPDYSEVIPKGKDSLKKGMNAKYLTAVLNALGNNPVDIEVDDATQAANQPHLFSSEAEDGIKCVVMPMRV